jgi:hypothetical protein
MSYSIHQFWGRIKYLPEFSRYNQSLGNLGQVDIFPGGKLSYHVALFEWHLPPHREFR